MADGDSDIEGVMLQPDSVLKLAHYPLFFFTSYPVPVLSSSPFAQ
jgi:hypothetical protein